MPLTRRSLRWTTGLVLLSYVGTHLANHALGLVSLPAAEAGREVFLAVWRSLPGTIAFYGALLLHLGLAIDALLGRFTLRMPFTEAVRLLLGFAVPLLLANHFVYTRLAHELHAYPDPYARIVAGLWARDGGTRQLLLMAIAWTHGCLGLHLALRHRPGYRRRFHWVFCAMLLLPLLAALGFVSMARELEDPRTVHPVLPPLAAGQRQRLDATTDGLLLGFAALGASVLLVRGAHGWWLRGRGALVRIRYPDRVVTVPRGWSVLEASRAHGLPHLSLCGGRARCSTCRVQVDAPHHACNPVSDEERRTLDRVGAGPGVRLACQLRPVADIEVTPLLPARAADDPLPALQTEQAIAILFIDLRRWTGLAEQHAPHDLVYLLDRYFDAVGAAVRDSGGVANQFVGDSVMAIFGLRSGLPAACRQALDAAARIARRLDALGERLEGEFGHRLDFGIGIHCGSAVVAEVGWRDTRTLSAVGDAVNTASRLQELTKRFGVRFVVSAEAARLAGLDTAGVAAEPVLLRGRRTPIEVLPLQRLGGTP
ncbi:adenylate/guanylate cyclase domain-containing protein [Caldimonas tepidiphila]|uniref:adenylate/guanylate cyclase domain-containing protein n=1 Tax=Caldimonas tepidiphila TaxID=2315841 RepID=UPI000E5AB868|nr:adenylate/guanylate cyclase domain-containing protein [Caldimonas tepidiphila]